MCIFPKTSINDGFKCSIEIVWSYSLSLSKQTSYKHMQNAIYWGQRGCVKWAGENKVGFIHCFKKAAKLHESYSLFQM